MLKTHILQRANPFSILADLKSEEKSSKKCQKILIPDYENYDF